MPWKSVTTAGTRVQLSTTRKIVSALTLQWRPANTGSIYVGFPGTDNTGAAVASTAYDCILNTGNQSVTLGMTRGVVLMVDLSEVWLDSSVSGEGVAYFVE